MQPVVGVATSKKFIYNLTVNVFTLCKVWNKDDDDGDNNDRSTTSTKKGEIEWTLAVVVIYWEEEDRLEVRLQRPQHQYKGREEGDVIFKHKQEKKMKPSGVKGKKKKKYDEQTQKQNKKRR